MAYFGRKLRFAVFLMALLPGWTVSAQEVLPSAKPQDGPVQDHTPSGVFMYAYRTPTHIERSSQQVFQKAVDKVSHFLTSKNVPVRKVVQAAPSRHREPGVSEDYEDLSVGRDDLAPSPSLLAKARASGARYVLFLVVDRPVMSWIHLRMQCFDLSGSLLWETQSANTSALTGKSGLKQTLKEQKMGIMNKKNSKYRKR